MEFDTFIDAAWSRHADDPGGTAQSLADGAALVTTEAELVALIVLAQHVHGEHLGRWQAGLECLEHLAASALFDPAGASGQALARCTASLLLAAGNAGAADALGLSDRIRATALAAACLAQNEPAPDIGRAAALWQAALAVAAGSGLPDGDAMHRTLAATGNNLASELEQKPLRTAAERELMLAAANAARNHWAVAGNWLEVERAEYRLASSWLAAGDAQCARHHAQACLDLVDANAGPALERFFGWEAMARAQQLAGNAAARATALEAARNAFAQLGNDDQAWCSETLEALIPALDPALVSSKRVAS